VLGEIAAKWRGSKHHHTGMATDDEEAGVGEEISNDWHSSSAANNYRQRR